MKILHLTRHMELGGIPRSVADLAAGLQSKGHEVTVASTGGQGVKALQAAGVRHLSIPLSAKFEFGPNLWRSWLGILPDLRARQFDVMHAHTRIAQVLAGLIRKTQGIPSVTTCHGFFKPNAGRRLWPCWGQKVIAVSPAVAGHLKEIHHVPQDKIVCIPNGIYADSFNIRRGDPAIAALRKNLGISSSARVIGTTARLSPVKGLEFLLDAFAACLKNRPDLYCLVVGDGPSRQGLESHARALRITDRVTFAGAVTDVAPYLAVMDYFVLPSLMEGLGLSILEAFAAGKPVVASRVGGIVNVVQDGKNGLLVAPGSATEIAQALERLLGDGHLGLALAQEALQTVRSQFSLDRMAGDIEELYKNLLFQASDVY